MRTLTQSPITNKRKQLSEDHHKFIRLSEKKSIDLLELLDQKKNQIQSLVGNKLAMISRSSINYRIETSETETWKNFARNFYNIHQQGRRIC